MTGVEGSTEPQSRIQQGIAYRRGERPAPCYRLLLLNFQADIDGTRARDALALVDTMLQRLEHGEVRDLEGQPGDKAAATAEQFEGHNHLVAYGRRLFDERLHQPSLTHAPRPSHLAYLPRDGPFPSLRWELEASGKAAANRAEADVALQLTGHKVAAINCAAVEVWKLIVDERLPLEVVGSFEGFARHDGRGWLEFHDGVSNMHSSQRLEALEALHPEWMRGGTYMAFLRLVVDLSLWRQLSRTDQELLVGRDRLTGAGLVGTHRDGEGRVLPIAAAPLETDPEDRRLSDFMDPPQTVDPIIEASHVHRANQVRGSPLAAAALRIFRQGYEFLDDICGSPRLGLNFVSFQHDLGIINHLLHLPGWLGDVNFGGRPQPPEGEPRTVPLVTVAAGGFFAVAPRDEPFPGASIFT